MHISYSVTEDCINHDSYGTICVWCNCCGRIDKATMKEAQVKFYEEQLKRTENFDNWILGHREIQEKNIKADIKYFKEKLAKLEGAIVENGCSKIFES